MNIVLITFYDKICLGNRQLSSVLKKQGHNVWLAFFKGEKVDVIDDKAETIMYSFLRNGNFYGCLYDVDPYTQKEVSILIEWLQQIKPDLIGISTRSFWSFIGKDIVGNIKKIFPNVPIIAGGYGPSLEPEKFLEFVDYVCIGEGEIPITNLVDKIQNNEPTTGISNIISGNNTITNYNQLFDIEKLPFPDWEEDHKVLIDNNSLQYKNIWKLSWYDVFTSRGCPYTCSYCMAGQFWDYYNEISNQKVPRVRLRTPEIVIKELLSIKDRYPLEYVRFMDSIFGLNREWTKDFLGMYKKYINLPFFANLEPRIFNIELGEEMVQSGLKHTVVGIQSASEEIRTKVFKRKVTDDNIIAMANFLHKNGITWQYDLIGWNPFENEEILKDGLLFLDKLPCNPDNAITKLQFFPKSELGMMYDKLKPEPLTDNLYYYYALIYSLYLSSEKNKILIKQIINDNNYKENPSLLKKYCE